MDHNDLIATPGYKKTVEQYAVDTLTQPNGQRVTSPQEAKSLAANRTGQSYTDRSTKNMGEAEQKKAMQHPNKLGAGARKRESLGQKDKIATVMKEYAKGTLHSGSGDIVKNPAQAKAIAESEAGNSYKQKQKDRKDANRFGMRQVI